jgi:hypothetical protein
MNKRQNNSSLMEFATLASVVVDGYHTLILRQNLAELRLDCSGHETCRRRHAKEDLEAVLSCVEAHGYADA